MLMLAQLRPGEYDALMQEGDELVAMFCLFVALEEISWGQLLLGYVPSAVFLEYNTQQETTLHNFANVLGKPKWVLAATLVAFGVLLPIGATVAPTGASTWYREVLDARG